MKKDNMKWLAAGGWWLDRNHPRSQAPAFSPRSQAPAWERGGFLRSFLVIVAMVLVFSSCSTPYIYPERTSPRSQAPDREQEGKEPPAEKHEIRKTPKKDIPRIGSETDAKASQSSYMLAGVSRLMDKANRQMAQENFDHAFATTERALRIDPSNAKLWSLLAEIQLKRGNVNQAEALAKKSNLLVKGDKPLQAKNWRIIAESLYRQGKTDEADQATRKAGELGN